MNSLDIWTVYERPTDYPQGFIARLYRNGTATQAIVTGDTLDAVRGGIPLGLCRMARHPSDDPVIVETWL